MLDASLIEPFRATLLSGRYNLLFGSGVSVGSKNGLGQEVQSAETLRKNLCALKAVRDTTTLPRAYSLLSSDEINAHIVQPFSNCTPSSALSIVPQFIWRRLFTFNVDDVIEAAYRESTNPKQTLIPLSYNDLFEPTPERQELHAIHLHGWVCKPDAGFVFSYTEYARVMSSLNPWMHLLSEVLATEAFIIAGTSLNEVDLEYYLSHRSDSTPRKSRGPSLLIEPYPDAATESDCERYGLTLVKAGFGDFLSWLGIQFPAPPTLAELTIPNEQSIFPDTTPPRDLIRFFTDFELIRAGDEPRSRLPSPFFYGSQPSPSDLNQHVDMERDDNGLLRGEIEQMTKRLSPNQPQLLLILDDAGTGKTTVLHRIGHDLTRLGQPVLSLRSVSKIDVATAITCITKSSVPLIVLVDGIADHAQQLFEILQERTVCEKAVIVATERAYRRDFIDIRLGALPLRERALQMLSLAERRQLIQLLNDYGLVGESKALSDPTTFAARLKDEAIAVAVCRILNDFRPLDGIANSLWAETIDELRLPCLAACLAHHCHTAGIRYSILQEIAGTHTSLSELFERSVPLGLQENPDDDEYVLPRSPVLGERILRRAVRKDPDLLLAAFQGIASGLAPHVNRRAIILRSPEARLAGRLFDADKITKPFLEDRAEAFYLACQRQWKWNSRYWEQRSLLAADNDLDTALQYARHAVAIEAGPFALTTLAKMLFKLMERDTSARDGIYDEAFEKLSTAIQKEERRSRIRIHPYSTLFSGTSRFIDLGGVLKHRQKVALGSFIEEAKGSFGADPLLGPMLARLDGKV